MQKDRNDPRAFCIEESLYDNSWAKDKMMRLLFMNGRHWKIMLIITTQIRWVFHLICEPISTMFILREPYITNRKRIWKIMRVCFQHLKVFHKSWINVPKILSLGLITTPNPTIYKTRFFGTKRNHTAISNWVRKSFGKYQKTLTPTTKKSPTTPTRGENVVLKLMFVKLVGNL